MISRSVEPVIGPAVELLQWKLKAARERIESLDVQIESTRAALLKREQELKDLIEKRKTASTEATAFQRTLGELGFGPGFFSR